MLERIVNSKWFAWGAVWITIANMIACHAAILFQFHWPWRLYSAMMAFVMLTTVLDKRKNLER